MSEKGEPNNPKKTLKGRNPELIERRNEKLADRLYFYRVFGKLDNDTALHILSREFDIAAFTIGEIAMKQSNYLKDLQKEEVTIVQLKKKWPYLSWNDVHPV